MLLRSANWANRRTDVIEHYFHQPAVVRRMRDGIMSPYLDALAAELEAQHYSRKSIAVIALWLGHESIETTHGYLEADLKLKEKALQKLVPAGQAAPRFQEIGRAH